jgi:hypothetical protein
METDGDLDSSPPGQDRGRVRLLADAWLLRQLRLLSPGQWNVIETSLSRKEIAPVNSNALCRKLLQAAAVWLRAPAGNGVHICVKA